MRNKGYMLLAAALAAVMLSGCDFIRVVAGRPTSSDLQAISAEIERKASDEKAAAAAVAELERSMRLQRQADSVSAVQALEGVQFKSAMEFKARLSKDLPAKYCVMLGAFSSQENAAKLVKAITEEGFQADELPYKSGITAVYACPTDDFIELGKSFANLRTRKFCPDDVWVLVNE